MTEQLKHRVLLVEDNATDVLLVREALLDAQGEFELVHAERLFDAMKRLSTQAFDVVLLDLGLPDSSGIETFSRLHAQAQNVPVIVLTGFDDDEVGLKACLLYTSRCV